jgi:hypothetical protein
MTSSTTAAAAAAAVTTTNALPVNKDDTSQSAAAQVFDGIANKTAKLNSMTTASEQQDDCDCDAGDDGLGDVVFDAEEDNRLQLRAMTARIEHAGGFPIEGDYPDAAVTRARRQALKRKQEKQQQIVLLDDDDDDNNDVSAAATTGAKKHKILDIGELSDDVEDQNDVLSPQFLISKRSADPRSMFAIPERRRYGPVGGAPNDTPLVGEVTEIDTESPKVTAVAAAKPTASEKPVLPEMHKEIIGSLRAEHSQTHAGHTRRLQELRASADDIRRTRTPCGLHENIMIASVLKIGERIEKKIDEQLDTCAVLLEKMRALRQTSALIVDNWDTLSRQTADITAHIGAMEAQKDKKN